MITTLVASLVMSMPTVDVKVDGEGYLRFVRDGRVVYAKSMKLTVTQGKLSAITGEPMMPTMVIPDDTSSLDISLDGTVTAVSKSNAKFAAGQIVIAYFENANQVREDGSFLVSSVRPKLLSPGEDLAGVLRTGQNTGKSNSTKTETKTQDRAIAASNEKPTVTKKTTNQKIEKPKNWKPGMVILYVNAASEVGDGEYTIGDIAEVIADDDQIDTIKGIPIGNSPVIGVRATVDRYRLIAKIRMAGFDPAKWTINAPQGAYLSRHAQVITNKQFADCAIAYGQAQLPDGSSLVAVSNESDFTVPVGQLELKCERFMTANETATATVAVFIDGRRINSRTVRLELRGSNGETLVRYAVGSRVKILVRSNGAVVQIGGRLNSAARVGQTVDVTTDNKTTHTGKLVAPGTVEVVL